MQYCWHAEYIYFIFHLMLDMSMQFQYLIFVFLNNPIDNICLLNIKYGKGMYGKLISKYDTPDWSGKSDITFVRSNE